MTSRQYATFEVDDQLFGVEVDAVQEVLSFSEYTPVPLAPPAVGGLFNLRGQVIAAVDLRVQLGLPPRRRWTGRSMNVDRARRRRAGQPARRPHRRGRRRSTTTPSSRRRTPCTGPSRDLIVGAFKLDGRLMLALDTPRAADTFQPGRRPLWVV